MKKKYIYLWDFFTVSVFLLVGYMYGKVNMHWANLLFVMAVWVVGSNIGLMFRGE